MKGDKQKLIALLESELVSLFEASKMTGSGQYKKRAAAESPDRLARSKDLAFCKFIDISMNQGNQMVARFETAGSSYDVDHKTYMNLVVIPGLTAAYKQNPRHSTIARAIRDGAVEVKCNCNDFKFRYEYWLNKSGSLAKTGDKSEQYAIANAPTETNPKDDKGPFCKHLLAVTGVFLGNLSNMSKGIQAMDLGQTAEPMAENERRTEGMIVLNKDDSEKLPAILGTPAELDANLAKDTGMSESEKDEVKDVLTKDESPELIDQDDVTSTDDDLVDEMNEIEPIQDDDEVPFENTIELSKDKESNVIDDPSPVNLEKDDPYDLDEPELEKDIIVI